MTKAAENSKSWLASRLEDAVRAGLSRAYENIRVSPDEYLVHLRTTHDLPVQSYHDFFALPVERLDEIATETVRAGTKMGMAGGAGFGLGGLITIVPDLGLLSAVTVRTIQKLSLVYGFEFNTDEERAELWVAMATAAGVDISRELLERTVISRFVERVVQKVAAQVSAEAAEKMIAKAVPVVSSAVGAALNYYFVRAWGRRALAHFRERHLRERRKQLPAFQN
jgi:hypothetical protein